jgi:hypothetical protein
MSASEFDPVARRYQTGLLARQLREAAGVDPVEAERRLVDLSRTFYATKLTKIEKGEVAPATEDVDAMVILYRPTVDEAQQLAELAAEGRKRARPGATPGAKARQYISLERLAAEIRMVYNEIPGVFHNRAYAHSVLSASPLVAASRVNALADERAERGTRILRPEGPRVWAVIGEDGLDRCSTGPVVLLSELEHLREAALLPNVKLRVILRSAGNVAGLGVPFTQLHMPDGASFAFVANAARSDYVKAAEPFEAVFRDAWERAESEERSIAILDARIADLRQR